MKVLRTLTISLLCIVSVVASAQTPLTELTAADGMVGDGFGTSVAALGNTAVVGAVFARGALKTTGAAYVFVNSGGAWAQVAKLTASDGRTFDAFGNAVVISNNTIVVGAPNSGGKHAGGVYVFVEPPGGWTDMTETAKLTVMVHPFFGGLGGSVAVSSDGNKVVTSGSPFPFVFVKPPTGWTNTNSANAVLPPPLGSNLVAGSFAMSGSTAVGGVGFPGGFAYVYDLSHNLPQDPFFSRVNPIATLSSSDATCQTIGFSFAISGNTIAAGAGAVGSQGAVCVYVEPPSGWTSMTQTAELIVSTTEFINLGYSVAVFGKQVVAGAPSQMVGGNVGQGAFYAYVEPPGGWVNTSTPNLSRTASDGASGDELGWSVAVTGKTIVTGAPLHAVNGNLKQGAAYVLSPQ